MTIVRKWSGDGLTAGAVTTSSAGTGDNTFNSLTTAGAITITETGVRSPRLLWPNTSNTAQARWTGLSLNDLAYRHSFSVGAALVSTYTVVTFYAGTDTWRVGMTYTGKLRLTNTTANTSQDSPIVTVAANTDYRIEVVRSGTTATAYLYAGDSDTAVTSVTMSVASTTVTEVWVGHTVAATNTGYTVDDIALSDQPHLIGPVSVAPPVDPGDGTGDQSQYLAIIGDSLTYQNGNGEANLEALLEDNGWYIPNISFYACSGKGINYRDSNNRLTTEDIAAARTELGHEPYMWVISLGTNGASGYTTTDINAIVTKINEVGSPGRILWIGCGDRDATAKYQTFNAMAAPVINATTNGEFLDYQIFASSIDPSNFNTSDGLHMPPQGYALRNTYVAEHIGEPPSDDPTGPQWYRYNGTSWVLQTVTIKQ